MPLIKKVRIAATCLETPAFRNGWKLPRRSADATGRSHRFPQKSDGLLDCVSGESEKFSMVNPVHMEVSKPSPEHPPAIVNNKT